MKNIFPIALSLLVLLGIISFGVSSRFFSPQGNSVSCTMEAKVCPDGSSVGRGGPQCEFAECSGGNIFSDIKNGTYVIENIPVTLINGTAEIPVAPGSASKIITRYFGNEAKGDLNSDGIADIAFLLTQEGGGSGTFFYLAAALKTASGYLATSALFLGDRISPQTMEIRNGVMVVNYGDRAIGEPMAGKATQGVTRRFRVYDD
mgnify:CR=1 FL=1